MSAKTPMVSVATWRGQEAAWLTDPGRPGSSVRLDSPAWFAWLEDATVTRFAYPICDPRRGYITGVMTVRKEHRRRGGSYWVVYRRCGGRVRKAYLGRAHGVTNDRLGAIAQTLLREEGARPGEAASTAPSY